ncbi:hypothetical protein GLOIN_2v1840448 [Rhizophagus irregularis DAOM 181602=DAOM 197198]|nr:hypothetical protein GLOIN_2v1840448 [Rhizophagus irregularis DAOM 181602=DAOM 197198]CAB4492510.1 unnamed protein product [Rhizophagus irregularis]CAB5215828.1 unnamed protein product [Rhizophagus irregularis]CAG8581493.1 15602_t:CDS:2 [Rhizophagus irregularis]
MKSHTVLNKCNFIITVVNDAEHQNSPGFLCDSKENQLGVCSSPTEAINTCYEKVFRSNAKFPGPHVMGFDNSNIIQQLLSEEEYKSILQSNFNGIKSAFVQEIEDNEYVVQIYTNDDLVKTFSAIDPDEVWILVDRESDILELRKAILDLCPPDHEINDREWHAWKAFVRNA